MPSSLSATSDQPNMSYLSASQSQIEIEDQPIVRPFRASALLSTHLPPTQHHPPSFPGIGQTLDAEGRVLPNEGRMPDDGHAHVQATVKMDGSDSHIQPPPATSSTTPVIGSKERMETSVPLHHKTKLKTWPLLPVECEKWSEEEYALSFKKVVEYLRERVDHHDRLRNSARNILYRLMKVGSSLESAKPSVLVMCNAIDWGSLNSLLKSMPSQEYNCMIPSTWDRAQKLLFRDRGLSRMSTLKPILWLYLCPTSLETLKRLYGVPVSIECSSLVTMCGSLVEFEGRQSTISLSLDIDGEHRLLTVEHIFQGNQVENDRPQMNLDPESLASIEGNIEQWDCLNDSEDDISMDPDTGPNHDDGQMDGILPATFINYNLIRVSHKLTRARLMAHTRLSHYHKRGERVEPPNSLPHQSSYLDWACLRLVDYQMVPRQRCNFLFRPGKPPGLLEDFATKPRTHAVPVFMISGILGVRSGRLIDSPSYLGSSASKEQELCETWTIILDQQGFYPGESGSIIVDQETLKIYGHLVGSDMFGYGHVVPFSHTMGQIKTAFNADNAGLPSLKSNGPNQEYDMNDRDYKMLAYLLRNESPSMSQVQQLIQRGADVNRPDTDGETLLCMAVRKGYLAVVELLLRNGADLSVPGRSGETPVWAAANKGHLAVVELLLKNGADLSVPNDAGETPVWGAAIEGHLTVVELLLKNGADLSVPNGNGETPVWAAANEGHLAVVELLLGNGADLSVPNKSGKTPLWRAVKNNYLPIVKLLFCLGVEMNCKNDRNRTPLWKAIQYDHRDIVEALIEAGAEVNIRDKYGSTPLLYAVQNGHSDVTQQLIKAGAEVNAGGSDGCTPLLYAALKGRSDIIQQLIEAGAEVNAGDQDGCTPLLCAVQSRRSDIIQQLIEAGAEVNTGDQDGCTPLLKATRHGYSDTVQQLIESGAEVDTKDKDGHTPVLIATRYGYSDITQQLIKASALLDSKDDQGQTALFIAVQRRNHGIIQMLIEGGAATDVEDNRGRTLLTLANKLKVDLPMHLAKAKVSVDEREG
ncbi:unnamed protein product [Clonostachys rhizophaga]|uniref:Uncharacterized protein n=1 Tax=Clonostachys rhizophaga TaxID=160324 RepID=A0A9N9V342_9HYPO|nr:unnamed protein product [Clonostachys rhizophaga]